MTYLLPDEHTDLKAYPVGIFNGDKHYFSIEPVFEEKKIKEVRNVVLNPLSQKDPNGSYPYASANIETRGESTFFACNAIDGYTATAGHGPFPYQSWGINRDPNAEFYLDFGKEVVINQITLYLRADYPHDSYWESVTITFDNDEVTLNTNNSNEGQAFFIDPVQTRTLKLHKLIKHEDESPFPALIEIEAYGFYL